MSLTSELRNLHQDNQITSGILMFVWVKTQCCLAKKCPRTQYSCNYITMTIRHNVNVEITAEIKLSLQLKKHWNYSCSLVFFFSCHSGCLENSRFLKSYRFPDTAIIFQTTIQFFQNQCKKHAQTISKNCFLTSLILASWTSSVIWSHRIWVST